MFYFCKNLFKIIQMKLQKYFNRDISWLSFNYRLLEEADDKSIPLYERLRFLAIYSSNLDGFYKVRVAEYKYNFDEEELVGFSDNNPGKIVNIINSIVKKHLSRFESILKKDILPELKKEGLILFQDENPEHPSHLAFIHDYFYSKALPHLQPVLLRSGVRPYMLDNKIYIAVRLYRKKSLENGKQKKERYSIIKMPTDELGRFIRLPNIGDNCYYYIFLEDLVRMNLKELFPGYEVDSSYNIKMLRDADLGIQDEFSGNLLEKIRKGLTSRKRGEPALFLFDRTIPQDFLNILKEYIGIIPQDMLISNVFLNTHDFINLPNPFAPRLQMSNLTPVRPSELERFGSMFDAIKEKERILHFPYHSFDYVLRFFYEASIDPKVDEIKVTQYRVATNSAVVNALINAAHNGKKVTVFVEVKARFDEENNLKMARMMENAGIRIIYSIPGLKVHAKMALVIRRANGQRKRSYAYLSTGNFNEKTARSYADHGFFTCKREILTDLENLFEFLEDQSTTPVFKKLLVTQFNFKSELIKQIDKEIEIALNGGDGYMLLKMNGIQNKTLINKLYEASEAGVKIDLIVRSVCCLIPNRPFSQNIRLIRIVDSFLEHARIWVFGKNKKEIYLSSGDWLNRNLNRRIEITFPIEDDELRQEIINILDLQLKDNVKARTINSKLNNVKISSSKKNNVRAQFDTYEMIARKGVID